MNYKTLTIIAVISLFISCNNQREDLTSEISIPVSVEEVGYKPIEKFITTTGTVYPTQEVELRAEIAGEYRLRRNPRTGRPYALGDRVNKGETIIEIEDQEYRNNLNIPGLKLNLEIANETLEKQKALFEKGGVSQLDLRNAEVDQVNAKNNYEGALISLAKMKVITPFSGIIVDLPFTTGGIQIEAGSTLLKLMNYTELHLEVNFPEKHIGTIKEGMDVRITNYTIPDDTIHGEITALSPAIDPETRTFKSALVLNNKELKFRPGMFVKADLVIASKDSALVIPKDVILSKQRGNTVFVIERGEARERVIEIGLENPFEVEILNGLDENERLVVRGFETLANRSKVTIVK